eukprot:NODE_100_length_20777_cov_0.240884.p10 type:complete len:193 gc:universal NODE_100_length_20777_cov_0.240884:12346-12924(+)
MSAQVEQNLKLSKLLIENYMEAVIETADSFQNKNRDTSQLRNSMVTLAKANDRLEIIRNAIIPARAQTLEQYQQMVSLVPPSASHPKVNELNRLLNVENGHDDDEILFSQSEFCLICSLTKKQFLYPVKATCGHNFEKSAILHLIKQSDRCICPFVGCGTVLTPESIQDDHVMMRRLERRNLTQGTLADVEI